MTAIEPQHVPDHQFKEDHHHLVQEGHIVPILEVQTAVMTAFLLAQVPTTGGTAHLPLLEIQNAHLPELLEAILVVPLHMFIQADWQLCSRHQDLALHL